MVKLEDVLELLDFYDEYVSYKVSDMGDVKFVEVSYHRDKLDDDSWELACEIEDKLHHYCSIVGSWVDDYYLYIFSGFVVHLEEF